MRPLLTLLAVAGCLAAQSHPAWWTYASPDATALVGIHWSYLRTSPFAGAVAGELSADGSLGFPDLPLVTSADEILISSPATLAVAHGSFPADVVAAQAAARDLRASSYKSVPLWITPGRDTLSVAQISDQLLLFGLVPALRDAIDRSLEDKDKRTYSPLLARAARFAQEDLWVVSSGLPDPLASLFIPLDATARSFEGSVSLWQGLHLVAALETRSIKQAGELADSLRDSVGALPAMADGTRITTDERAVYITMDLTAEQLAASMRGPTAPAVVAVQPTATVAASPVEPAEPAEPRGPKVSVVSVARTPGEPRPASEPTSTYPEMKPRKPRVIRILGLDSGPREIPMSPGNHPQ